MSAASEARAGGALDAALALARSPRLAQRLRAQPLPDDVTLVLRLLAGDPLALYRARAFARPLGVRRRDLAAACELYVQQVILHPEAGAWRALGLAPEADRQLARDHFRLLMLWLHPDRAGSNWREPFARRAIDAWAAVAKEGAAGPTAPAAPQPDAAAQFLSWARHPRGWTRASRAAPGQGLRGLLRRLRARLIRWPFARSRGEGAKGGAP